MKIGSYQKINRWLIFLSFILIVLTWNRLPPQIPLYFGRPWGEDQLAPKPFIFLLPTISAVILLANRFWGKIYLKKGGDFFNNMVAVSSLTVATLNLICLIKIILIIIQ